MKLTNPLISLNPVRYRYLLAAWQSPTAFLHKSSAIREQLFVSCLDPVIRRIEIYFKASKLTFVEEGLADVSRACQQLKPSPLKALIMTEDSISHRLLKQIPAKRSLGKQVVLVATKPSIVEHQEKVRILSEADKSILIDYNDEFSSVDRLFDYHCIQHPTPQVSAWGWFSTENRLEGICFVHCQEPMPEVLYLHVRREARGKGCGRQLLAAGLNWSLTKTPTLYYVTADENQSAIRMCQSCGFTIYASTQSLVLDIDEIVR